MPNVPILLDDHVTLKVESYDRIFLNGYVAKLQDPDQLSWFLCQHRGEAIPRYQLLGQMTRDFVAAVTALAEQRHIPVVHFERGQRKEEVARPYFEAATREGVVLIGIAQERARVFRPPAKGQRVVGKFAAHRNSAFVNHVYFYIWDGDFGPSFIKFCTYAPFAMRVWLNGHQWAMRQLQRKRIRFEPLDNGIAWVEDPAALQRLCDRLSTAHLQRYVDRWLYRLPNPFTRQDRRGGYTYQLSVLQLEVSRTEVFDRPLHGRQFFEEVIREHLDLGRPDQLQIVFGRRIPRRRGAGPWRTRVFTEGVEVNLQVAHRHTRIKQYLKHGRALRTETTFNDTYDFGVGRLIVNLDKLRTIGRAINRRLVELERAAHRCTPAASVFEHLVMPTGDVHHRAPGLRVGDPRVVGLFGALARFRWQVDGFRARDLQPLVAQHLGQPYSMGQMAYDLRRLGRKQLIERRPHSQRYQLTRLGLKLVCCTTKLYGRLFCRALARLDDAQVPSPLQRAWRDLTQQLDGLMTEARMAA